MKFKLDGDIESPRESKYLVNHLQLRLNTFKVWVIVTSIIAILSVGLSAWWLLQNRQLKQEVQAAITKASLSEQFLAQNDSLRLKLDSLFQVNLLLQADNDLLVENSERMEGIYFEVLIGGFEDFNLERYHSDLAHIKKETFKGSNRMVIARFRSFKKALLLENDLKRIGLKDVIIVGLVDGAVVSFKEALEAGQKQK